MPDTIRSPLPSAAKQGAQPGNQNARKHGLYSHLLPAAVAEEMEALIRVYDLKEEIALVRLHIRSLLAAQAPGEAVMEAIELLSRLVSTNHRLYNR